MKTDFMIRENSTKYYLMIKTCKKIINLSNCNIEKRYKVDLSYLRCRLDIIMLAIKVTTKL